jgi:uncharacterized membrane protein YfcA
VALAELSIAAWAWLLIAAIGVGFAKTAIGGVASVSVVIFAATLPARESTGALLPLLIVGDVVAVAYYRRHGSLSTLLRLLPGVVPGLLLGAVFVRSVDDSEMRLSIGLILLVLTGLQLWLRVRDVRRGRARPVDHKVRSTPHSAVTWAVGATAGFATMTANAAGPVMTLYLILAAMPVLEILGTGAWFFLVVNLAKLPFSAGLSLISLESLMMDALLVPALLIGAVVGAVTVKRLAQRQFEVAALTLGGLAALLLLL